MMIMMMMMMMIMCTTIIPQVWELHRLVQLQRHLVSIIDVPASLQAQASNKKGTSTPRTVVAEHPPRTIPRTIPPPPPMITADMPSHPPPTTLQQTAGQLSASPLGLPLPHNRPPLMAPNVSNLPPATGGSGSNNGGSGSPTAQHGQSRPPKPPNNDASGGNSGGGDNSGGHDESGKNGSGQHNSCQASNPEQQGAEGAPAGGAPGPLADPTGAAGVPPPLLSGYSSVPPHAGGHGYPHAAAAFTAYGVGPPVAGAMDPVQAWYHQHYSAMMMAPGMAAAMYGPATPAPQKTNGGPGASAGGAGASAGSGGAMRWWADPMMVFGQAVMPTEIPGSRAMTSSKAATGTKRPHSFMQTGGEPSSSCR